MGCTGHENGRALGATRGERAGDLPRATAHGLKYEHLYRAPIDDGGALGMETARFRDIYKRIRPHQALDDRTPRRAYLDT